jgi:hypothetical protein
MGRVHGRDAPKLWIIFDFLNPAAKARRRQLAYTMEWRIGYDNEGFAFLGTQPTKFAAPWICSMLCRIFRRNPHRVSEI